MAITDDTFTIPNIKKWLQGAFLEMVWEDCGDESDYDLASYRAGVAQDDGHYFVGITTGYCWVAGGVSNENIFPRRPTPYDWSSVEFAQLVRDITDLKRMYKRRRVYNCGGD